MANEVLASKRFMARSGEEVYEITLDLVPSGASDYGNRHALLLNFHDGSGVRFFDARYDKRFSTVESFSKYALEFVKDQLREDFTVEQVA